MRKIIVSEFVTLDGVIEAPDQWQFPFWNEEAAQYKFEELMGCDALLLGRKTYDTFAAAWPSITDETGFANRMNNLPKYVVSTTLSEVTWNARLITRDVVQHISRLKQEDGRDLLIYGSGELAHRLGQDDLIDEYRLMVHPIIVGGGQRLFNPSGKTKAFQLGEAKTFRSGIVVLSYSPRKE